MKKFRNMSISTHDLTKRSTLKECVEQGGVLISTHDLTKRSTRLLRESLLMIMLFQLTTSRRGRQKSAEYWSINTHFNSRPHEEVDCKKGVTWKPSVISTHDLTKRSTYRLCLYTLRQRYFNSRPHEEVDLPHPVHKGQH